MIDGELECNLVILLLHVVEDGLYVNETLTNLISDVTRDNLRNISGNRKRQDQTGHFDGDVFSAHIHIT